MEKNKNEEQGNIHGHAQNWSAPYPVSRLAPPIELVDLAKEIESADKHLSLKGCAKLQVIADQIKALQIEARKVLEQTQRDQEMHRIACKFKKIPGHIYHLYKKKDGQRFFSMLSPKDWKNNPPQEFIGSYILEADMSWQPADRPRDNISYDSLKQLLSEKFISS